MRASIGLGFIAMISLLACTASGGAADTSGATGPTGSSTDPNTPAPGESDPSNPDKPSSPIVANLAITDVAVFQGVKVAVVKGGASVSEAKRNAPVVAKRPGLVRVYMKPAAGWTKREVTAELRLVAGTKRFPIISDTKTISAASTDADVDSTFNLEVPADDLPAGVTFQVALTAKDGEQVKDGDENTGRFPTDGSFQDLGAHPSGTLKVVVVPVEYDADGSGRTPDISAKQLALYKQNLMKLYPTSDVEVTAHAAYPWTTKISGNGSGFSSVLSAMHQLRQHDGVDDDVYYYGLLTPASSMTTFCGGGCVAGLSTVADVDTPMLRASVGLGYVGQDAADTMVHEVGHAHGRDHAPCGGPSGIDPDYPYTQAQIGVWGYDIFEKTLISPTKGRDMMAYCPNQWISDYTYNAIFERMVSVNSVVQNIDDSFGGSGGSSNQAQTSHYSVASVGASGELAWETTELDANLEGRGAIVAARYLSETGAELGSRSAHFFRFDHLPGGLLFVPHESKAAWKSIRVDGYRQQLLRK